MLLRERSSRSQPELVEIRADKDFRDTIERLVQALRTTSGR
jgi:hypothetical protein